MRCWTRRRWPARPYRVLCSVVLVRTCSRRPLAANRSWCVHTAPACARTARTSTSSFKRRPQPSRLLSRQLWQVQGGQEAVRVFPRRREQSRRGLCGKRQLYGDVLGRHPRPRALLLVCQVCAAQHVRLRLDRPGLAAAHVRPGASSQRKFQQHQQQHQQQSLPPPAFTTPSS